jgi:hypothetical protein
MPILQTKDQKARRLAARLWNLVIDESLGEIARRLARLIVWLLCNHWRH